MYSVKWKFQINIDKLKKKNARHNLAWLVNTSLSMLYFRCFHFNSLVPQALSRFLQFFIAMVDLWLAQWKIYRYIFNQWRVKTKPNKQSFARTFHEFDPGQLQTRQSFNWYLVHVLSRDKPQSLQWFRYLLQTWAAISAILCSLLPSNPINDVKT